MHALKRYALQRYALLCNCQRSKHVYEQETSTVRTYHHSSAST